MLSYLQLVLPDELFPSGPPPPEPLCAILSFLTLSQAQPIQSLS